MPKLISDFATRFRPFAVAIVRSLPKLRGRGRISHLVNTALLAVGAEPKAVTQMLAGHLMYLDTRSRSHCWAFYLGVYNDEFIHTLLEYLRDGGVVLDVGANIGFVTVPLSVAATQHSTAT